MVLDYKKTVYLAHPLEERKMVRKKIQPLLEEFFYVKNPFSEKRCKEFGDLTRSEIRELVRNNGQSPSWIVTHDLKNIAKSDALFAYMPYFSFGTSQEIAYAYFVVGIPVIIVSDDLLTHPWAEFETISVMSIKQVHNAVYNLEEWFE